MVLSHDRATWVGGEGVESRVDSKREPSADLCVCVHVVCGEREGGWMGVGVGVHYQE